MNYSNS